MTIPLIISEANTARVERQKNAEINVIIGNPPYNARQVNENDNNKNRSYHDLDKRVQKTYVSGSGKGGKDKLSDPYVKFFRWASDRLEGRDGIVCYVSNNSFVDSVSFEGMRMHLMKDFHKIYHLDLHGNIRQNPKISGTSHNVFGIKVGVGITIAVRSSKCSRSQLFYHRVPEFWRKEQKLDFLKQSHRLNGEQNVLDAVDWQPLEPNRRGIWRHTKTETEFESYVTIGKKYSKRANPEKQETIFKLYSLGVETNRDGYVFGFSRNALKERMAEFVENYNAEVDRYRRSDQKTALDDFVDPQLLKWNSSLKKNLKDQQYGDFNEEKLRLAMYRPFTTKHLYMDRLFIFSPYRQLLFFPCKQKDSENKQICVSGVGHDFFYCLLSDRICELKFSNGSNGGTQCFPFYTYDEDGSNRFENITDWALNRFRAHYKDAAITKWKIFYYIYGLLHHRGYRKRFGLDMRRQLPRIPFAPDFYAFSRAGSNLADYHLNFESVARYKLTFEYTRTPLDYAVEKMVFRGKRDSERGKYKIFSTLKVNNSLTLRDIPERAFDYRLGIRSAVEWIVNQYSTITRSLQWHHSRSQRL